MAVNFFTLFPTHIWVKINLTCWWHTLKSKGQGETSWFLSWTAGGEILVYYPVLCTVWTEIKVNSYISTLKPLPFFSDCVLFPQLVLSRKMSFYIVTYYLPSGLFVVVSWISFLVNPEVIVESFLDRAFPHPGDPRSDDSSHHHLSRPHQYIQHHPNQLTSGFTFLINFWFWFAYICIYAMHIMHILSTLTLNFLATCLISSFVPSFQNTEKAAAVAGMAYSRGLQSCCWFGET